MRASIIIPIALFSNFFGSFISEYIHIYIIKDQYYSLFYLAKSFYTQAILINIILFISIMISYCLLCYNKNVKYIKYNENDITFQKNIFYYIISCILIVSLIILMCTINFSFDISNRGINQFVRGQGDYLSRIIGLLHPMLLFYYISYCSDKKSRMLFYCTSFVFIINESSYGGRGTLLFFFIFYLFCECRKRKFIIYNVFYKICIFIIIFIFMIVYRIYSHDGHINNAIMLFFDSTIGSIGCSQIHAIILYYISNGINFFYGTTFINTLISLFCPSFLLYYLFGYAEIGRSSLYFNMLFNDNPNHGFDFSLLADFLWNFGYFGYFIFACLFMFLIKLIIKNEKSNNSLAFGLTIIITNAICQGLRRDFGAFSKLLVYYSIFYLIMYIFSKKIHKSKGFYI